MVGASALAVAFGRVQVASSSSGVVLSIDPAFDAILGRIGVGVDPSAMAAGDGAAWVANAANRTVDKIDPAALAVNGAFDRQALTEEPGPAFPPTCQIIPPDYPSYRAIRP